MNVVFTLILIPLALAQLQSGVTTRYWDCCKPSCTWPNNVGTLGTGATTVRSCLIDGTTADPNAINICGGGGNGGPSYSCTNQQPWYDAASNTLYGFVASNKPCCQCVELIFGGTGPINGVRMIAQVTNSGGDLGTNHFDIQMPGGGFGIFNGCSGNPPNGQAQFSVPTSNWGAQYGGLSAQSQCSGLPAILQPGCNWRWDHFFNADNPPVQWQVVNCPTALTDITGCWLASDPRTPSPPMPPPAPVPLAPITPVPVPSPATVGCPSYGCGCSWATQSTCLPTSNDGSQCWAECCCKGGWYTPPGPNPLPLPIPSPLSVPVPRPLPLPIPRPLPNPLPLAVPVPVPRPVPVPVPRPLPLPVPRPVPVPVPRPVPVPVPVVPVPVPVPQNSPRSPLAVPVPVPVQVPVPAPIQTPIQVPVPVAVVAPVPAPDPVVVPSPIAIVPSPSNNLPVSSSQSLFPSSTPTPSLPPGASGTTGQSSNTGTQATNSGSSTNSASTGSTNSVSSNSGSSTNTGSTPPTNSGSPTSAATNSASTHSPSTNSDSTNSAGTGGNQHSSAAALSLF